MDRIFHRDIEKRILQLADRDEAIVIRGPRQAGKTTLMKLIAGSLTGRKEFVDFDVPSNRNAISESPIDYVERLSKNGKMTLFFDEIQRLDNAGEIIKVLYDAFKGRVKIFASGSSSLEIKQKVLGFLVGRALVFELYTFGFGEFLRSKDEGLHAIFEKKNRSVWDFINGGKAPLRPSLSEELLALWKEYLVFGGYPEVVKADGRELKETLLANLINLYIEKDVASFFKIDDTKEFENFVRALSFNDSQMLLLSGIGNDARLTLYKARGYLNIIENTYIAKRVYPYYKNLSTAIRKTPKIYFMDLGMRNAVLKNLLPYEKRDDVGKLAENFVFREIVASGKEPKYWRTTGGAEMDFVIETGDGVFPIEVKLGGGKALGKGFYSFLNKYKPKRALVVTLDRFFSKTVDGTVIYGVPAFYL
ncbi:MAG: ATP-binding protein [Candidatus Marsarchaeota archaeon]|nr:ATP-binding protein [Candidatus Marsarchaeota archaeon]